MGKHTNGYMGPPSNPPSDPDRDSPRDDDMYDALADLFLSDHPAGSAMDRSDPPAIDDDFDDGPEVEGVATLKFVGEQAVTATRQPAPRATVVKPTPAPSAPLTTTTQRPAPAGLRLESLVLGHLPVMASAWATQYAQSIVDTEAQPVACLRLASGHASLDVFGIGRQLEPAATIDAAIKRAAKLTDRWILRADAPSEPGLAMHPEITDVTLLVGADEAAVVAAYRTIKGLVGSDETIAEDTTNKRLRVAIMGAGQEQADTAYSKIAHTVEVYLGQSVERAPRVEKIRPAPSASLFRGQIEDTSNILIDQLLDALSDTGAQDAPFTEPIDLEPAPEAPTPSDRRVIHEISDEPARPMLTGQLDGLSPLRARCPFEPLVELAFDQDARLHTLEHADNASLSSLLTATSWAAQHAELIALTTDAHGKVRAGMAPTMHVFTDRPNDVRRLLDTEVRVHLLSSVTVNGSDAWCCTDLN